MKRLVPGLLLLVGIVAQVAQADYVIIRAPFGGPSTATTKSGTPAPVVGNQPANTVYATALIEIGKRYFTKSRVDAISTRVSTGTTLYSDDKGLFIVKGPKNDYYKELPTVSRDLKARKDALKNPSPGERLELAQWVLARGLSVSFFEKDETTPLEPQLMLGEFREQMEELKKQAASASEEVRTAVKGYEELQKQIFRPLERNDVLEDRWKDLLGCQADNAGSAHYTLLYKGQGGAPPELKARVLGLERVFEGFYSWFALKGKNLPLPKKRLVVVVLDNAREFRDRQATFDAGPLVVDGFLARREQLAFFFNEPLDDGYQALAKSNQATLWSQGWNMGELLKPTAVLKKANINVIAENRTLALLQRAMQEEGDLLAGTHLGVEQLVTASGLLPRTVPAPQWIQFGMPSCFAASRGALWAGFGGPNWDYLLEFKQREGDNQLDAPAVALRRILSDEYFHRANASKDKDALRQARCLAWALTYYLLQRELDGLLRYYEELATLPRELELDEGALLGCFARAFKLESDAMPGTLDEGKLNRLAAQWFSTVGRTPFDNKVQEPELKAIRAELKLD
jgi:hypothetical protein